MGILRSGVQPFVLAMLNPRHDRALGGGLGAEFVDYDPLRRTSLLAQEARQQSARSLCVPVDLHDFIKHAFILMDGAPEVAHFTLDGDDNLLKSRILWRLGALRFKRRA